jgi:hypothetical protein
MNGTVVTKTGFCGREYDSDYLYVPPGSGGAPQQQQPPPQAYYQQQQQQQQYAPPTSGGEGVHAGKSTYFPTAGAHVGAHYADMPDGLGGGGGLLPQEKQQQQQQQEPYYGGGAPPGYPQQQQQQYGLPAPPEPGMSQQLQEQQQQLALSLPPSIPGKVEWRIWSFQVRLTASLIDIILGRAQFKLQDNIASMVTPFGDMSKLILAQISLNGMTNGSPFQVGLSMQYHSPERTAPDRNRETGVSVPNLPAQLQATSVYTMPPNHSLAYTTMPVTVVRRCDSEVPTSFLANFKAYNVNNLWENILKHVNPSVWSVSTDHPVAVWVDMMQADKDAFIGGGGGDKQQQQQYAPSPVQKLAYDQETIEKQLVTRAIGSIVAEETRVIRISEFVRHMQITLWCPVSTNEIAKEAEIAAMQASQSASAAAGSGRKGSSKKSGGNKKSGYLPTLGGDDETEGQDEARDRPRAPAGAGYPNAELKNKVAEARAINPALDEEAYAHFLANAQWSFSFSFDISFAEMPANPRVAEFIAQRRPPPAM